LAGWRSVGAHAAFGKRGGFSAVSRPFRVAAELDVAKHRATETHDVAVAQPSARHLATVDERAGRAAVVEDPHAIAADGDDRVAARDVGVLKANIGDEAPKPIKEGVEKDEADKLKTDLEEAGGSVELK
jgi:hypothetical protein